MKRKFILYPAVALALMASASLSSCVDTDEPESLEALRNAKAEELRANAALINAKSDVEKAYVAVVNAKAAQDEAIARQQAAVAAMEEYKAALDKVEKDLAIAKVNAKSEAEIEEAKLKAENALSAEKEKVEQAKYELQDAIAKYKEKIDEIDITYRDTYAAFLDEHNDLQQYRTDLRKVTDAKRDLADAQLALADALAKDDKDFQDAVDNAQRAYDLAVGNKETAEAMLSSMDIAKITEQYNELKAKKDAVQWKSNEYDLEIAKLNNEKTDLEKPLGDGTTDGYKKTFNEKESALNNAKAANSANEANYKNSKIKLEVACGNSVLQAALGDKIGAFSTYEFKDGKWSEGKTLNAVFKYDKDNKKYVAVDASDDKKVVEVRQDQVEDVLKEVKKEFTAWVTKVTQNEKDYDVAVEKLKGAAAKQLNDVIGKDNKSLLRGEWYTQVTNFNNAKAKNKADLYDEDALRTAIQALFGTTYNWKAFTSTDAFTDAETWLKQKEGVDEIKYDDLGEYGKWRKLVKAQSDQTELTEVQSKAQAAVDAIKKYETDYTTTLAAKQKADKEVNNADAVKKAQAEFDAAKKQKEDQEALVKAVKDKITAKTKEKAAVASDSLAAYNNILNALAAFSTDIKDAEGKTVTLTVNNFESKKEEALKALNEEVAKKAEDLAKKQQELADYKAGRYDKVSDIRSKQDAVRDAERALEDAEAELERTKSKLSVTE